MLTRAAGQFLMALDSSVMNVSIAKVAEDVGTTVSGIQGAIVALVAGTAACDRCITECDASSCRRRIREDVGSPTR
ncbi:hypothetical protein ACFYZ4_35240 [Streptomyces sp. NPDC001513]|uniref:hypothetical protein n=1 Tax=Streptomyces sp. NPDC001513 TaxID=3364580 RepID=UPI0036834934